MRVTEVLDHWLEAKFRHRRWMRIPDATACVREEVRKFVQGIERVAARELSGTVALVGNDALDRHRIHLCRSG